MLPAMSLICIFGLQQRPVSERLPSRASNAARLQGSADGLAATVDLVLLRKLSDFARVPLNKTAAVCKTATQVSRFCALGTVQAMLRTYCRISVPCCQPVKPVYTLVIFERSNIGQCIRMPRRLSYSNERQTDYQLSKLYVTWVTLLHLVQTYSDCNSQHKALSSWCIAGTIESLQY